MLNKQIFFYFDIKSILKKLWGDTSLPVILQKEIESLPQTQFYNPYIFPHDGVHLWFFKLGLYDPQQKSNFKKAKVYDIVQEIYMD